MGLVLASASPRRKELLKTLTPDFRIVVSESSETDEGRNPRATVTLRAIDKARDVSAKCPDDVVIGCDTMVVLDNKVYGKPKDEEDARRILRELSGKWHEVYTGVAFLGEKVQYYFGTVISRVKIRDLTDEKIDEYIQKFSPLDKAGAYAIQDDFPIVETYEGSYTNIVGFPTEKIEELLQKEGIL